MRWHGVGLAIASLAAGAQATTRDGACWRNTSCSAPSEPAFPGPWEANIFAPESRIVRPQRVLALPLTNGTSNFSHISLSNEDLGVVLDFGVEVGGIISIDYQLSGFDNSSLGLAFTEAKDYVGRASDNSNGGTGQDGALVYQITSTEPGTYTVPDAKLRGGFRYLTLFLDSGSEATLDISDVRLEISFQPTWSNLRAYQGYFHSSDELLNRIWYSGAYTLQINSVPWDTGRASTTDIEAGWRNDEYIGPGDTVLLDGAKRDRWVWIGDMGTAVPSAFVSTGDLDSTRNALKAIFSNQGDDGLLPKAGPPHLATDSDTYHMWALIGTYNYFLYSGDYGFVEDLWPQYISGMNYSLSKVTDAGIVNVTGDADWGRFTYSTERSSASMLLHRALQTGADIARWAPNLTDADVQQEAWSDRAVSLQGAIMAKLWDDDRGAFKESPDNTDLYPQDANSMSIAFGVLSSDSAEAGRVSDYLESNWTPIGASCPELTDNISPFISSIELTGHFEVGRPDRALKLIRDAWGWYINHPNGTQSTVAEGYLVNGTWGYRGARGYRYDPTYVSHAHGWSSGPTSTLTDYLVGLIVTEPAGQTWELRPRTFTELSEAEAGFTTNLGKFSAKFTVDGGDAVVEWDTPEGTRGYVALPGDQGVSVQGGKGSKSVAIS